MLIIFLVMSLPVSRYIYLRYNDLNFMIFLKNYQKWNIHISAVIDIIQANKAISPLKYMSTGLLRDDLNGISKYFLHKTNNKIVAIKNHMNKYGFQLKSCFNFKYKYIRA